MFHVDCQSEQWSARLHVHRIDSRSRQFDAQLERIAGRHGTRGDHIGDAQVGRFPLAADADGVKRCLGTLCQGHHLLKRGARFMPPSEIRTIPAMGSSPASSSTVMRAWPMSVWGNELKIMNSELRMVFSFGACSHGRATGMVSSPKAYKLNSLFVAAGRANDRRRQPTARGLARSGLVSDRNPPRHPLPTCWQKHQPERPHGRSLSVPHRLR